MPFFLGTALTATAGGAATAGAATGAALGAAGAGTATASSLASQLALGSAIASAGAGIYGADRANKAAREQARAQAIQNRAGRIRQIAQGKVLRAQQVAAGEGLGASFTTGLKGNIGATRSQVASSIGLQQSIEQSVNRQSALFQSARNAQGISQLGSTFASVASLAGGGTGNVYRDIGEYFAPSTGNEKRLFGIRG